MENLDHHYPYSLTHELRPGYLYVKVKGEKISYETARSYWDEVIELRIRTHSDRVLVDKDIPATLSITELYQLGAELAAKGFERSKVALFDRYADLDHMVFSENVMKNRGLNGKGFTKLENAEEWLMSN